jgi:hypothetical protein
MAMANGGELPNNVVGVGDEKKGTNPRRPAQRFFSAGAGTSTYFCPPPVFIPTYLSKKQAGAAELAHLADLVQVRNRIRPGCWRACRGRFLIRLCDLVGAPRSRTGLFFSRPWPWWAPGGTSRQVGWSGEARESRGGAPGGAALTFAPGRAAGAAFFLGGVHQR